MVKSKVCLGFIGLLIFFSLQNIVYAGCIDLGIVELNAKVGRDAGLKRSALTAAGVAAAGTLATNFIAVARSNAVLKSCTAGLSVVRTGLLTSAFVVGGAAASTIIYFIKRSKNLNSEMLLLANQIVNGTVSLDQMSCVKSLVETNHVKYGREVEKFFEIKTELSQRLAHELSNQELAELIVYLDNNTHVKNSEKVKPDQCQTIADINPFCSFTKTSFSFKEFKFKYVLSRKIYRHKRLVELLEKAYLAKNNMSKKS